jgi:hypothetical protein
MDRAKLLDTAVYANESYRVDEDDRDLEIGFLYGTAEMIVALTIMDGESYSDLREELAREIDKRAAPKTYAILDCNK